MSTGTVNVVRKISTKNIGLSKIEIQKVLSDKKIGERVFLYSIAGLANRSEQVDNSFGNQSTKFFGDFVTVLENGEETKSNQCFVPEPASSQIENQLAQTKATVEFGYRVYAEKIEKQNASDLGYKFDTEPVVQIKGNDRLEQLKRMTVEAKDVKTSTASVNRTKK
jgi:hypothetical protein